MNRVSVLSLIVVLGGTSALIASTAQSQVGPPKAYVALQPTTPGTSQSGHANVSGTLRAAQLVGGGAGLTNLSWGNLASVPPGFADGIDNDTLYTAGSGLGLFSNQFRVVGPINISYAALGAGNAGIDVNTTGIGGEGVDATSAGEDGIAIRAASTFATGFGLGVYATCSSTTGVGVAGYSQNPGGQGIGVIGGSSGATGMGVVGEATNSGNGLTYGVRGLSASNQGRGVYGEAYGTGNFVNYGVYGVARSQHGVGVYGEGFGTSGSSIGVKGVQAGNVLGVGVYGSGHYGVEGFTTSGYGVYGRSGPAADGSAFFETQNSDGRGIVVAHQFNFGTLIGIESAFLSPTGRGIQGDSDATTGTPYAVFGDTDGAGWALYASGNSGGSGTKSFRIDHPLDPENKYLLHYSSESPVPQNFYVGNIVTDARGFAWVQLPDYFDEINEDFKYQLTVIDGSDDFVLVKVVREIENNRFQLRTSKPSIKVSWRVDANRNDAYVRKYRPAQELDKPEHERGLFEHPEIFGYEKHRSLLHDQPSYKAMQRKRGK